MCRLDGTVKSLSEREEILKTFTRDHNISVFLLTTQVGGVGLTITAADRVVICESVCVGVRVCVQMRSVCVREGGRERAQRVCVRLRRCACA